MCDGCESVDRVVVLLSTNGTVSVVFLLYEGTPNKRNPSIIAHYSHDRVVNESTTWTCSELHRAGDWKRGFACPLPGTLYPISMEDSTKEGSLLYYEY